MEKKLLKLYVVGRTPSALRAIKHIDSVCREELNGEWELEVVDVLEKPQLAEDERIVATPVLVRKLPPPVRRVVGDFSDSERVLLGLNIVAPERNT